MKIHSLSRGFTLVESIIAIALTVVLLSSLCSAFLVWGQGWQKSSARITLQQNARIAMDAMVRELRYTAGNIVTPATSAAPANTLEFRNTGDYKTLKFYTASPAAYPGVATLYRYVKDDRSPAPGVDQLTEPSQVYIKSLSFDRKNVNTVEIRLVLSDRYYNFEEEIQTTIVGLNN